MGVQFFWFYDILLVAIVLGVTFRCFKKGFISSVLGFLAVAAGFIVGLYISEPVSEYVYTQFVEEKVAELTHDGLNDIIGDNAIVGFSKLQTENILINGKKVSEIDLTPDSAGKITLDLSNVDLSETGIFRIDFTSLGVHAGEVNFSNLNIGKVNISTAQLAQNDIGTLVGAKSLGYILQSSTDYGTLLDLANQISDFLPRLSSSDSSGTDIFTDIFTAIISADTDDAEHAFSDEFIKPIVMVPLRALVFFILFALVSFLLSLLSKAFKFINKVPVLGTLNALLGGAVGALEAAVILCVICIVLHIIISLTGNTIIFLNVMTINETFIFKYIYNLEILNFAG